MLASIKSEFKKLLTVRSTYILTGLALIICAFTAFYALGYAQGAAPLSTADKPFFLDDVVYSMLATVVLFASIVGILLVTHEYRYNTISYTLTSTRRRMQVFASKFLVMIGYTLVLTVVASIIGYFGAKWGVSLKGIEMAPQNVELLNWLWRFSAYAIFTVIIALGIAFLVKNTIAAVVIYLIAPVTVENLLMLVLKDNADFLPFKAIDAIAASSTLGTSSLTALTALGIASIYVVAIGAVSAILFVKRDASS